MKFISILVLLLIIIVFQIPLIQPFFRAGHFITHDGDFHTIRIFEYYQSLKYGQIPPRLASGLLHDYSYPVFIFNPPLAYLLGATLVFLGFNLTVAAKLLFVTGFLIGSLGIFFLLRLLIGNIPALIGSLIYSLIPYRAVDAYVRGNLAEFLAYSFFPWLLLANLTFLKNPKNILYICYLSLSIAILILLHSISSFIYFMFLLIFNSFFLLNLAISKKREGRDIAKGLFICVFLAILLSCFYWLPVIIESSYVRTDQLLNFPYSDYFLSFKQMWYTSWGYGFPLDKDGAMSLQLGQVSLVVALLAIILNMFIKTKYRKLIYFLAITFGSGSLLETSLTKFVWDNIPILHLLEFPWRFHILTTVSSTLLVGFFFYLLTQIKLYKRKSGKFFFILLAVLFIFLASQESFQFFKPRAYSFDFLGAGTTVSLDEYTPKWVKTIPQEYTAKKIVSDSKLSIINNLSWGYNRKSFDIINPENTKIRMALIYYPGWEAYLNNVKIPINYDNDQGLIELSIQKGEHSIYLVFNKTWWRLIADIISTIGLLIFILLIFFYITQRKNNQCLISKTP